MVANGYHRVSTVMLWGSFMFEYRYTFYLKENTNDEYICAYFLDIQSAILSKSHMG